MGVSVQVVSAWEVFVWGLCRKTPLESEKQVVHILLECFLVFCHSTAIDSII